MNTIVRKIAASLKISSPVLAVVLLFTLVGALVADIVTKKRQVNGEANIELCQRDDAGGWKVVDRLKAPASFEVSVATLASGKELKTDFVWNGRSEQGRQVSVRWGRPGKVNLDAGRGLLELEVPIEFAIDGKRENFVAKLTTESVNTPTGNIRGEKAVLTSGKLTASLVGVAFVRSASLLPIDDLAKHSEANANGGFKKRERVQSRQQAEPVAIVLRGKGVARS